MGAQGFLALPWLWGLNAWLWHGSGDPVIRQYAKRSAIGAALAAAIAIPWAATFTLGGPRIVGRALFDRLNVATWDLDAYGLRF